MAPIRIPGAKPAPAPDEEAELAPIALPPQPHPAPVVDPLKGKRTTLPPDLIPGYVLEQWLGEGTMGAVYRARQVSLDRMVAVKILTPHLARNETYLKRFQREARAVAKLNHPNVVSGIDVGESRGCRWFVMEYVEGPTLFDLLEREGRLDSMTASRLVLQVARALDHAHRTGLVHRDVKPANIIVTSRHGQTVAKLCDLGLARDVAENDAETGRAMGTPFYISPEQARGDADTDIRSDIYSLGATYYHAVCGSPPFAGANPAVIMAKHLNEALTPVRSLVPEVPLGVAAVVERCLRKERESRYQTPQQMIDELELVVEGRWRPPMTPARRRFGHGRTRRRS